MLQSDSLAQAHSLVGRGAARLPARPCREILPMTRREPEKPEKSLRELVRTNDPVLISFLEALLKSEGIGHVVLDQNMSILDGSLGILPRRVMVENSRHASAVLLLKEAGLDAELSPGSRESPQ
jgi:hypothetical protein